VTATEDKVRVPSFIYGTAWKAERTKELVLHALDAGFRGIDTANQRKHYHEAGVGEALLEVYERKLLTRDELFLQSKFTFIAGQDSRLPYDKDADTGDQVRQSFASSLEHLHTDYLDSYILHGPSTAEGLQEADWKAWHAMEALAEEGKTRFLGISNVSGNQLQALWEGAKVKPRFCQNRCYASRGWDGAIRTFCDDKEIVYQGFSLLTANRQVMESTVLAELATEYERSCAQILFRFALHSGMLPLTGTTNPEHMNSDLAVLDFELRPEDISVLEDLSNL